VGARTAKVGEDVCVVAPGFFQGVGEDGKTRGVEFARRHDTLVVGGLGEVDDGGSTPDEVDGDGSEGVAEDVME
jgi:hypothetical protein